MSTLGFLISLMREVPTESDPQWGGAVNSWINLANSDWFRLWEALPQDERKGVPRMPPGFGLSTKAADASGAGEETPRLTGTIF